MVLLVHRFCILQSESVYCLGRLHNGYYKLILVCDLLFDAAVCCVLCSPVMHIVDTVMNLQFFLLWINIV